ncbi:GNAT family N-acetyltransferase [Novosphingobium cyanobacteriorum]|uniref:GNAT family N-acetyltransferase n=1 Tax=Novosphingobium cyanobacteriorum TaxID=3024215 RepID=UPI0023F6C559|nr:GNAT family N-acetyltransferase [Novosphingobium cyanobacteriorum]
MKHPWSAGATPALSPTAAGTVAPVLDVVDWQEWSTPEARAKWDDLAARSATPNPFFESWLLLPALAALAPSRPVRIATVRIGGSLVALFPLARAARHGRHPLPHLATWLHANCFLGAPLVAAGFEQALWQALFGWADSHAGTALFLHLAAMPLDGPLADALVETALQEGRRLALVHREERALLQSNLSPESYLAAAVPGKKRKEYRRQRARLGELGDLQVVRSRDGDHVEAWIEAFLALEAQGWKGRAGSALACAPGTAAFFRQGMAEAARRGRLERLSLELDGQPIAMLATLFAGSGTFSFKTAFDERFARFSPGVLLQLENLDLLQDPARPWCDSCAAADHPMIDSLWTERRAIGRFSIAIGGRVRRAACDALLALELGRNPVGIKNR